MGEWKKRRHLQTQDHTKEILHPCELQLPWGTLYLWPCLLWHTQACLEGCPTGCLQLSSADRPCSWCHQHFHSNLGFAFMANMLAKVYTLPHGIQKTAFGSQFSPATVNSGDQFQGCQACLVSAVPCGAILITQARFSLAFFPFPFRMGIVTL